MCFDNEELHDFLDSTVNEVYRSLDIFIEELEFAVAFPDLKKLFDDIAHVSTPSRDLSLIQRDLAYLTKMKEMDENLRFEGKISFSFFFSFFSFFFFFSLFSLLFLQLLTFLIVFSYRERRNNGTLQAEPFRLTDVVPVVGLDNGTFPYL